LLVDLDRETGNGEQVRRILANHFRGDLQLGQVDGHRLGVGEVKARVATALRKYTPEIGLLLLDRRSLEFGGELVGSFRNGHMPPVIALGPFDDATRLMELRDSGAADFASSPVTDAELIARVSACLPSRNDEPGVFMTEFNARIAPLKFITRNAALIGELQKLLRFAAADGTILLTGETGTGKEILAHAAHRLSRRAAGPFVVVDCTRLPPNLVESTLFGHVRGAFTGATSAEKGRLLQAEGGTVFIDEINSLDISLQGKLLRVLETGEIDPVGSSKTVKVNTRVIAATNSNLLARVRTGAFREDLWYRLNVLPISVPPLRERLEDITALATEFLRQAGKRMDSGCLRKLTSHRWQGNVRDLKNFLERTALLSGKAIIAEEEIDLGQERHAPDEGHKLQEELDRAKAEAARALLRRRLLAANWNVSKVARNGQMDAGQLRGVLKDLGINRPNGSSI